jgi:hypothetical protein
MLPNVVYTAHRWWTHKEDEIIKYGAEKLSHMVIDTLISWRNQWRIPIWLGEFGGPSGGNVQTYDPADNFWQICYQLVLRCEENAIPWNLWGGRLTIDNNRLAAYAEMMNDVFKYKLTKTTLPLLMLITLFLYSKR